MSSLRSFIKAVRAAKTVADERSVIQKESAAIRTSFRDDFQNDTIRRHNVAKLLYLYTLGERTHFGQIECLKLLATAKFGDKRLGYLATMLLLDENQEVLTLLTNSLSNDLSHPNQYVTSLALCTLANIASTEMARDLSTDIEKIMSNNSPFLRKKAALCAMRIINRVPELEEMYIDKSKLLLNVKLRGSGGAGAAGAASSGSLAAHGLLLCGCALITEMCLQNPALIDEFKPFAPLLIKELNELTTPWYSQEHDVVGVNDPFLQVKILRLLRILAEKDDSLSEKLSDVLAHIVNRDTEANASHAVSYEAVLTIFGINSESGLRVLGVNILGRFLGSKDNNIRYVALNTLLKVVEVESVAVQRHRATIVECLKDNDISIRRRALELSYSLINEQNIRVLARELLTFLETADVEFKSGLVSQVALAAERFAPNKRWHIDTIIRALKLAGSYAKENVLSSFITLVISAEDLHLYTVQKLYSALRKDISQEGLTLVSVWLLGEYGDVLLKEGSYKEGDDSTTEITRVTDEDVVDLLENVLSSSFANNTVGEYVVNALMKLSVRITSAAQIERIRRILESKTRDLDVELQQRVVEYLKLFNYDSVRRGVLEKIPPPELREDLSKQAEKVKVKSQRHGAGLRPRPSKALSVPSNNIDMLLDLASDVSPDYLSEKNQAPTSSDLLSDIFASDNKTSLSPTPAASTNQNILDLFGTPSPAAPATTAAVGNPLDGLFGNASATAPATAPATEQLRASTTVDAVEAYNKNDLNLKLSYEKVASGTVNVTAHFKNSSISSNIDNLTLQVAVPKTQKLALQAISSSALLPGGQATQNMKVTGPPGGSVKLRMRLSYSLDGNEVKEQLDFNKFPASIL